MEFDIEGGEAKINYIQKKRGGFFFIINFLSYFLLKPRHVPGTPRHATLADLAWLYSSTHSFSQIYFPSFRFNFISSFSHTPSTLYLSFFSLLLIRQFQHPI